MTLWKLAFRSLVHFWRANAAVAFGVAIATAVLTGALIVGQSMRESLKELTLDRLGQIDEILVSDGFFRAELANEIAQTDEFRNAYSQAIPLILFPNGTVELEQESTTLRASQVNVLGVDKDFWSLGSLEVEGEKLFDRRIVINQTLAKELGLHSDSDNSTLTLRIPKPRQLPSDSALGKKDDLVEALVDLEVVQIVPDESLGRFGLHPSQTNSPNLFAPIELIQKSLQRGALEYKGELPLANVILLSGKNNRVPSAEESLALESSLRPELVDHGITVKRATQSFGPEGADANDREVAFEYWSLSSDRLVLSDEATNSIQRAIPNAKQVFTYLANDIRKPGMECGVPFSMVSAIDFGGDFDLISSVSGEAISPILDNEIVVNEWTANDLELKIGDQLEVVYFEPESTHGSQVERTEIFVLADIAKLTEPAIQFSKRGRSTIIPAVFEQKPTRANDPDLTPEVPGLTDADTIEKWDLPFATDNIRTVDELYWDYYRTTPKAFVSLAAGQRVWQSRFGKTTSFRIPVADNDEKSISQKLRDQFAEDNTRLGFTLVPIKRNGLNASSGSTPFDALFLGLSMFVIAAALILVSLLFRLGLQNRAAEVGLFRAVGFETSQILSVWLREMLIVCGVGACIGVGLGIGYGALMILGLTTWWLGAISEPFITLHLGWLNLLIGLISGIVICIVTIWWSLRRTNRESVSGLLAGELESTSKTGQGKRKLGLWTIGILVVGAIGLSFLAVGQSGDAQAGAFMGSGFLILAAILIAIYGWLCQSTTFEKVVGMDLGRLAMLSARRSPLRSTLTIGLVAAASFLIVAVSSFRLAPSDEGTAGFDFLATSSQPVFVDLNTAEGQVDALGAEHQLPESAEVLAFRLKPGEDASCNNVYQSTQPQVLGLSSQFIDKYDEDDNVAFAWAGSSATTEEDTKNPWRLLMAEESDNDGAIPCVIDKNTAMYSLKVFSIGQIFSATYDSGETVKFRVVGFLSNTILQGSLLVSEDDFVKTFSDIGGYRYFLIEDGGDSSVVNTLEDRLSDQGFDATSAPNRLAQFMQVQNTYLSTFQSLGALGLLLGTFGLAAVQIRNIVQRKNELGLMRAVGFSQQKLSRMVLLENAWLLLLGLGTGVVSAIFATVPHFLIGSASVPWLELALMFLAIAGVGLAVGWLAASRIGKIPLLESLRA